MVLDWVPEDTTKVAAYAGLLFGSVSMIVGTVGAVLGVLNRRDQIRERRSKKPFCELRWLPLDSDGPWFAFKVVVHNPGRTPFRIELFEVEKPKGAVLCFVSTQHSGAARPVPGHTDAARSVPTLWEIGPPRTEQSAAAGETEVSVKLPEQGGSPELILFRIVLKGRYQSFTPLPVRLQAEAKVAPAEKALREPRSNLT